MSDNFQKFKKEFGANLKRLRKLQRVTQEDLANSAGLTDAKHVSKIEAGEKDIQLFTIFKLAEGLQLEPKELFIFDIKGEVSI